MAVSHRLIRLVLDTIEYTRGEGNENVGKTQGMGVFWHVWVGEGGPKKTTSYANEEPLLIRRS